MRKKILIFGLIALTITLGFLREYIFVSVNMETGQGPSGSGDLFIWKWVLTFAFSIAYLTLSGCFLYFIFSSVKYIRLAILIYALLFFISFLVALIGYLFYSFSDAYPYIRKVLGVAQSPIITMILIPACFLNELTHSSKR